MLTAYKRCHWFNSDFHSGFVLNDNQKISEISFDVNPFQINVNNNIKVITYIREATQSKPIQIKLKEPYNQSREVFNDDNEGFPIIYTNHTGTEGMNNYYPYSVTRLIPQQIPRFTFRVDDNYNSFFSSSGTDVIYRIFNYTGSIQTFNVPTGVSSVNVYCWGAGGGSSRTIPNTPAIRGGNGGFVKATLTIPSGTTSLGIIVGQGGSKGSIAGTETTRTAFGGGGSGVNSYPGWGLAGGGGLSGIFVNDANFTIVSGYYVNTNATALIIAGGGGGAGGYDTDTSDTHGGNGGFTTANDGLGNRPGGGGTQSSGGAAGSVSGYAQGTAGSKYLGGNGATGSFNPGGGGGYYGGGAGGVEGGKVSGAGGGSSFVNTGSYTITNITNLKTQTNGTPVAVGNTETYYQQGIALGGLTATSSTVTNDGLNGLVVIEYFRKRIEGITPEETLIQATNTNIPITIDSQYQINYQTPVVLSKGTYETIFNNGTITFKSKPDYSYPNTSKSPIIWYKFDTNIGLLIDSSGNSSNLINNGATLDNNNYKRGDGSLSVGNNKYVSFINDIQFRNIQTTNGISISVWFKGTTSGSWSAIFSFGVPYSDGNTKVFTAAKSASTTNLQFFYPRAGNSFVASGTNYFNNTWYHLIWTITNVGVSTIYINGVNIGATLAQENFADSVDYNTNKFLGRGAASTSEFLDGNIDDFRIYDYVLSPVEVYDLYNGNTDRSYPILKDVNGANINPLVWYQFDGSMTGMLNNASSSTNNLTNSGITFDSNNFIKGNGSIISDAGTNTNKLYITSPTLNLNTINSTNGITFSFWFRSDSTSSSFPAIFDFSGASTGVTLTKFGATTDIYFINTPITGGQSVYQTSGTNFFNNNWYHIVWSISTTGIWNIYVNNSIALNNSSRNIINIDYTNTVDYVFLNRSPINSTNPLKCNIDDFRIYSQVLTATQVSELYNGRLAIYNPPGFILGTEIEPEA